MGTAAASLLSLGVELGTARIALADASSSSSAKALPLGLRGVDEALPDGGFPRGAVVELAASRGLACATTLALSACAAAQAEARLRGTRDTVGAWCAWIDPYRTLCAPAVLHSGVDLTRLLVVQPPLEALARVAVRVVASRAFSVVVIDVAGVPGAAIGPSVDLRRWPTVVRRLALAAEGGDTTIALVTDRQIARTMPLPVAMRIELERPALAPSGSSNERRVLLRVAKDRRGRISPPSSIVLESA
jgi:recombination protein RecA